jgi:5-dehydro-2-deoxygluconokinase
MPIGLVGIGRIGAFHAATLSGLDTVDQVVMADADPARAQAAAKELDCHAAADVEALFRAGLDGVAICTPASSHAELIARAQDAGRTTFCEKPVASDLASTLLTAARVAEGSVLVQIGSQRRFDPGYLAARAAVTSGSLGWIHTIRATTNDAAPPHARYIRTSGGFYRDCSIHDFDAVRFVTGREVVNVFAVGQNRGAAFFAESDDIDAAAAVLTMDDGTIALISGSRDNARGYDVRLEALGSKDPVCVGMDERLPLRSVSRGWTFSLPCPTPTLWIGFTKPMSTSWSPSPTSSPAGSPRRARPRRPWRPSGLPRHAASGGEKAARCCWKRWASDDDRGPRGGGAADERRPRQYGAPFQHCPGTSMNAGAAIHAAGSRAAAFDVLTIGRVGVNLYPLQPGTRLQDVETFGRFLGGSPTKVAVAAARYGRRTAVITWTGPDPFGVFIHQALRDLAVDDRYVSAVDGLPPPITFGEIFAPDDFPLYFYRFPAAPDLQIQAAEIDLGAVRAASVYWSTVTGLLAEPSRDAHFSAWQARGRAPLTILDLDYRPMFWGDPGQAHAQVDRALSMVTVAVGNCAECEVAVGERDPDRAAEALLDRGIELAVVKQGPQGVLARTRLERVEVAAFPVEMVNGLGAGDAFGGALCHGLLTGWPLEQVLRFANVAGAIVASRLECSTAMPTDRKVEGRMDQQLIGELQIPNDELRLRTTWPLDCSTEVRHE